jgi:outer membrane protein assembly factor BamB
MAAAPVTHRYWLPIVVLLGALAAGLAIREWPSDDLEYGVRNLATLALGGLTVILLAFWLLFLSRFPAAVRLAPAGALLIGSLAFLAFGVREVHFSGDMVPVFTFRWQRSFDDLPGWAEEQEADPSAPEGRVTRALGEYPDQFSGYRGGRPLRDGKVSDTELMPDWKIEPTYPLWRHPVGGGYSGIAIGQVLKDNRRVGLAVTLEQRRDNEAVTCYDGDTGRQRWSHDYPAHFTEAQGGPGPRATPTIVGEPGPRKGVANSYKVYSLGATGVLTCLDLATGQPAWPAPVDVLKDNQNLTWGMAGSPLGYDGLVVVTPGAQTEAAKGRAIIAYDAATGQERWASGSHRGSYSSPMLAQLCGRRQILSFDGDGLTGYDAEGGRELWHYPWVSMPGQFINIAQPLALDGDRVFLTSGYGVGCAVLQVKESGGAWSAESVWQNRQMRAKMSSPVERDGFLYGLDDGILVCLDAKTGARRWKGGRYGHGQLLLVGQYLLLLSESGDLVLVEATSDGHRELGKMEALDGKTWNPLSFTRGFAFVRNDHEMACYELPGRRLSSGVGQSPAD